MQKAGVLVPLLVLGFSWSLRGMPTLPEPLHATQENFDLEQVSEDLSFCRFEENKEAAETGAAQPAFA